MEILTVFTPGKDANYSCSVSGGISAKERRAGAAAIPARTVRDINTGLLCILEGPVVPVDRPHPQFGRHRKVGRRSLLELRRPFY